MVDGGTVQAGGSIVGAHVALRESGMRVCAGALQRPLSPGTAGTSIRSRTFPRPDRRTHPLPAATMNATALRARSTGEILDLAFQLYRRHWVAMAGATGILMAPVLILVAISPTTALPIVDLLSNFFFLAATAAVVVITSRGYRGQATEAMVAVREVGRRYLSVWGAAIIQGLVIGLGLLLLIIRGSSSPRGASRCSRR
jgi:hypothetical protein